MSVILPSNLKKGDTIAITCPGGYMQKDRVQHCIDTLQKWGYDVMLGKTIGSHSENYFSGTDEERADELQAMLDDPRIKAIIFGRGGYGMSRIIDKLNFNRFKKQPKWLVGFSDITLLHCHVHTRSGIATIHGPMAAAFNPDNNEPQSIIALHNCLKGRRMNYEIQSHQNNKIGIAIGELIGGNLAMLAHISGSRSDIDTRGKILFIEDIGELLYNTDRMMIQLKRSGKLKGLSGLIFGGFSNMKDTLRPYGKTVDEILADIIVDYDYPVCFGFPISHDWENVPVKMGLTHKLTVGHSKVTLKEMKIQ